MASQLRIGMGWGGRKAAAQLPARQAAAGAVGTRIRSTSFAGGSIAVPSIDPLLLLPGRSRPGAGHSRLGGPIFERFGRPDHICLFVFSFFSI